jgi:transcription antitermination protein NusB
MKTSQDPRHQKRIQKMEQLFSYSFRKKTGRNVNEIIQNITVIDENIQKAAPEWTLDKIAKIDLAILRLSVYELTIAKNNPAKVIIDEAVELAKAYGNQNSPQFVNGVLGTIYKQI